MATVAVRPIAVRAAAYCLNHTPETGLRYGNTPWQEGRVNPASPFLADLGKAAASPLSSFDTACRYAPHLTYIGAMTPERLAAHAAPCLDNLEPEASRFGKYGEIMPEDEFIGLLDICDVFDLIWLEKEFASLVRAKLSVHPLFGGLPGEERLARLETGHGLEDIDAQVGEHRALPLYFNGRVVGCCREGHATDENLSAHVLLENLASKAGAVLALLHLIKNAGLRPADIDFVVDCSEEAAGDISQRGGGNMAKAIAESAGCANASGFDVRAFCAGPVSAIITSAGMVAAGARKNVAVVSGGSIPKLYMNAREHVKKNLTPLENCLGCFAVLLTPSDALNGTDAVIRLDALGKHTVAAGASPQAVTSALVWEPLQAAGLNFADIDKYAPELHDPEVTMPAGAGNVPEANFKMIAALAVMKGQCDKTAIPDFVKRHGLRGFAPTQGHIPSGVPYLGHALDAIKAGEIQRAMIIGKGSLFLGRLTNLADGASFILEKSRTETDAASFGERDAETVIPSASRRPVTAAPWRGVAETPRQGEPTLKIGLMVAGSELGQEEVLRGGLLAQAEHPGLRVVAIGPRLSGPRLPEFDALEWLETPDCEADIAAALEHAVQQGLVAGAVAMHFPFPIGVATIGRIVTPGRGLPMFIASCTGSSAAARPEALLRNAVYGIATAKACGIAEPSVAFLNSDGAGPALRALARLRDNGYPVSLGASQRGDGGFLLRGNDILSGAADVLVCDTLTGNALVKIFSAFTTGGQYESQGWGYGPSAGEGWNSVVSIISRASGAPVIANALALAARATEGRLPAQVAEELRAARVAGFDAVLQELTPKATLQQDIAKPPVVPVDAEIAGVDVLDMENAAQALWKHDIYAETAMGCTGPVVRVQAAVREKAVKILKENGFL